MEKSYEKLKECLNKLIYVDWLLIISSIVCIIVLVIIYIKLKKGFYKIFSPLFIIGLSIFMIVNSFNLCKHIKDLNYLKENKPYEITARLEKIDQYKTNSNGSIRLKPYFVNTDTNKNLDGYTYINVNKEQLKTNKTYKILYTPNCKLAYIIYD